MNLPVPVALNRFAAALRVLSFGMSYGKHRHQHYLFDLPKAKKRIWDFNFKKVVFASFSIGMTLSKMFLSSVFISISGLLSGCTTQDFTLLNSSLAFAHKGEYSQRQQIVGNQSLLLVGLKSHLGKAKNETTAPNPLSLISGGRPLILKDANGVLHKSTDITITWRKVPLSKSRKIRRLVAGPFASFESAEQLAVSLKKQGLQAKVAYPNEWEVWVPHDSKIPKAQKFIVSEEIISFRTQPVLKGGSGEILLSGPLQIGAPDGLQLNNGIYLGPFRLQADAYGSWTLIEEAPLERYLHGVVPHEIGSSAPPAALAAQAVLARTWALANSHRFAIDGYNLCSDTQCQVYKDPKSVNQRVKNAISQTAGKYLSWNNKPIHAVYHASNGGVMASASEAWSMAALPYLKPQIDGSYEWRKRFNLPLKNNSDLQELLLNFEGAYGKNHSRFRWIRTISAETLRQQLPGFQGSKILPSQVKVLERGDSGRVIALEILDEKNQIRRVLKLDEIRRILRDLPSTLFVVNELKEGLWQFSGGGFGHGAGLSQAGAIDLALRGWNHFKILRHYYPGAKYRTLQD